MNLATTAGSVVGRMREADATVLAAAVAYYAFVSVLPGLLLAIAVATAVGGEALAERVLAGGRAYLAPAGEALLVEAATGARGRAGASVLGVAGLVWGTLRVFRGLDLAFSRVYGVEGTPGLGGQVVDALLVVGSIGAGLWVMVAVGAAFATVAFGAAAEAVGYLLLLGGLAVVFLPLYSRLPGAGVDLRAALPGTLVAAAGWVGLQVLFQAYVAVAPSFELYGFVGGVLVVVTWFYVAAVWLLVGAALNAVLADRSNRQEQGEPDRGD